MFDQAHGKYETSLVDSLLEDQHRSGNTNERQEVLIKNAAAQIFGGMCKE